MISPRERGRYSGLLGGVMAVATVGGPLLGGLLVDTSWLGWRWCFYVGVPFAAVALVLLQRTLHLPVTKRNVHIDYLGAAFLTAGVSALLIWVTLAGDSFAWVSTESRAVRRRRRCSRSSPSSSPSCGRRSRSSRSASSATGRRRWPSSPASRSVSRCSARRSSSASTCRSRAATRRRRPGC